MVALAAALETIHDFFYKLGQKIKTPMALISKNVSTYVYKKKEKNNNKSQAYVYFLIRIIYRVF